MQTEPQKEHEWLHKLVGEWTFEAECPGGPDQPVAKHTGSERVRSLGGLWIVAEGQGEMPGGGEGKTIMTLGFDPQKGRYTGTWIGSMMNYLWIYEGTLDAAGKVLTLCADGPSMAGDGTTASYQDVIELVSDDHRVLSSHLRGDDGKWSKFMTAHYRRTK
jgi:hypothetical protein